MEKKFINSFSVKSKYPELLGAFKIHCERLGWKYDYDFCNWSKLMEYHYMYLNCDDLGRMNVIKSQHMALTNMPDDSDSINLETNWNEAVDLARDSIEVPSYSEYQEALKVIKRYKKYCEKDGNNI